MDKCCKSKPLTSEGIIFFGKVPTTDDSIPKENAEFVKKLKGDKGVVPFPFVLLIQTECDGPWELLNTNIPNFKLRTHKPFRMLKQK